MNNYLIISNIILWLAVIGLVVLVVALSRQVGVLFERVAPAGALMINKELKIGMPAPILPLSDISSNTLIHSGKLTESATAQLIFFLSPSCPVCKTLLPVIKSSARAEKQWLDVILASDGEQAEHLTFIEEYQLAGFPYVLSQELGMRYGVSKLPFAVLIDRDGNIASMGLINSREHLESLFESMEMGVDSIQSYMKSANQAPALASEI